MEAHRQPPVRCLNRLLIVVRSDFEDEIEVVQNVSSRSVAPDDISLGTDPIFPPKVGIG
jgi:hypothetical protein